MKKKYTMSIIKLEKNLNNYVPQTKHEKKGKEQ